MSDLHVEGSFEENVAVVDAQTALRMLAATLSLLNPLLLPPLRTYYRTRRPIKFKFTFCGSIYSGTIPEQFVTDGFTIPVYRSWQRLVDKYFWREWLVHDYLVTGEPILVDGVARKLNLEEINAVLPPVTSRVLTWFPVFLEFTMARRGILTLAQDNGVPMLPTSHSSKLLYK